MGQKSVAKNNKNGCKHPLDRRPILIPKPLLTQNLVDLLIQHGKGYSSNDRIEPIDAAEVLRRLPAEFQGKRLLKLFLDERDTRLSTCQSEKMRFKINNVFSGLADVKIGSYDPSEDEAYVPPNTGLARIIKMPKRKEQCQSLKNTQQEQSSEITTLPQRVALI